jgi:ABC-type multidrug transport system fused ATPase/permease subunit
MNNQKFSLNNIGLSLLTVIVSLISVIGFREVNQNIQALNGSNFDFIISGLTNNEQVAAFENDSNVESFSSFFNINTTINSSKRGNILFALDQELIDISPISLDGFKDNFFPDSSIIIDQKFSQIHGLNLNDLVSFILGENEIYLRVSHITSPTSISSFDEGVAYAVWRENYNNYFDRQLTIDYVFLNVINHGLFLGSIQESPFGFQSKTNLLTIQQSIRSDQELPFLYGPIIFLVIIFILKVFLLANLFQKDSQKIKVARNENRDIDNLMYLRLFDRLSIVDSSIYLLTGIFIFLFFQPLYFYWLIFLIIILITTIYFFLGRRIVVKIIKFQRLKQ